MKLLTNIEIDETETEVSIEFASRFGEIEIELITDLKTGDAIAPDLMDNITAARVQEELNDYLAEGYIELENHYKNI